jgi:hypothetical protein
MTTGRETQPANEMGKSNAPKAISFLMTIPRKLDLMARRPASVALLYWNPRSPEMLHGGGEGFCSRSESPAQMRAGAAIDKRIG